MSNTEMIEQLITTIPALQTWNVERLLGEGRFGRVYQICRQGNTEGEEERAALKWIQLRATQDEIDNSQSEGVTEKDLFDRYTNRKNRCLEEIRIMQMVQGETPLVNYHDYYSVPISDGIGWNILIRMELLVPLKTYLSHVEPSVQLVLDVGKSIASALSFCHHNPRGKQIIHGDVKIGNVFFSREHQFKLGDFGLSFIGAPTSEQGGTFGYLAPECSNGSARTVLSDQYALGMTLYALFNDYQAPIREHNMALSRPKNCTNDQLWEVISKATEYDSKDRFSDIDDMLRQLEAIHLEEDHTNSWEHQASEENHQQSVVSETKTNLQQKNIVEAAERDRLAGGGYDEIDRDKEDYDVKNDTEEQELKGIGDDLEQRIKEEREKEKRKKIRIVIITVSTIIAVAIVALVVYLNTRPIGDLSINDNGSEIIVSWNGNASSYDVMLSCATNANYLKNMAMTTENGYSWPKDESVNAVTWHVKSRTATIANLLPNTTYWLQVSDSANAKRTTGLGFQTKQADENIDLGEISTRLMSYRIADYNTTESTIKEGANVWDALLLKMKNIDTKNLSMSDETLAKIGYTIVIGAGANQTMKLTYDSIEGKEILLVLHIQDAGSVSSTLIYGEDNDSMCITKKLMAINITELLKRAHSLYPDITQRTYSIDCYIDRQLLCTLSGSFQ